MADAQIEDWFATLSDSDKLIFLATVMGQLTIHGRAFGLDLAVEQQTRAFTGLNELQHQLSNHSVRIGMKSERYPDDIFLKILKEKALYYGLSAHLSQFLDYAKSRGHWQK